MAYRIEDNKTQTGQAKTGGPSPADTTAGIKQSATTTAQQQAGTWTPNSTEASTAMTAEQLDAAGNKVDGTNSSPKAAGNGTSQPGAGADGTNPQQYSSYEEMFRAMNPNEPESPEMARRRERKERTQRIISAVGDGLRAISDMYFAYKGGKTNHDPKNDLSAQAAARLSQMKELRMKNEQAWQTGLMKARQLDDQRRHNDMTLAETIRANRAKEEENRLKEEQRQKEKAQELAQKEKAQEQKDLNDSRNYLLNVRRVKVAEKNAKNNETRTNAYVKNAGKKGKETDTTSDELTDLMVAKPEAYANVFKHYRRQSKMANPASVKAIRKHMIKDIREGKTYDD